MPGGSHPPPSVIGKWFVFAPSRQSDILNDPLSRPRPNYVDPTTQGDALEVLCIFLPMVATTLVAARIYARLVITKAAGLDDILISVAMTLSIGLSVLIILDVKKLKLDRHIWDIPPPLWSENALYQFVGQLLWLVTTVIIKISILLYYRRLSGSFSPKFKIASWVGIWYNIAFMLGFLCVGMLYCRPLAAYWRQFDFQWLSEGHEWSCPVEQRLSLPVSGALSVVGDFYSTLLPLCLVYTLKMPKRQKRALYLLFVFGFLVVTAGLVRTILLNHLTRSTYDSSWRSYKAWTWSILELYLAIIIASAPALKPFFRKYLVDPIGGTLHRTRRYGGSHDGGSWPARSFSGRSRQSCGSPYQKYGYGEQASLSPVIWKDPSGSTKGPSGYLTRVCHDDKV